MVRSGLLGPSSSLLDTKAVVLIRAGKLPDAIETLDDRRRNRSRECQRAASSGLGTTG